MIKIRRAIVIQSDNTGNFFKYVNKLSNKKGICALIDDANQVVDDDAATANMFNVLFASNCVVDNGIIPETTNVAPNNASPDSIDFNPSSVLRALKKVKSNESSGPDGFPPLLFHKLANCLVNSLSIIYKSFMSVSDVSSV